MPLRAVTQVKACPVTPSPGPVEPAAMTRSLHCHVIGTVFMDINSQTAHKSLSSGRRYDDRCFTDRLAETWGGNPAFLECHQWITGVTRMQEPPDWLVAPHQVTSSMYPSVLYKHHIPLTPKIPPSPYKRHMMLCALPLLPRRWQQLNEANNWKTHTNFRDFYKVKKKKVVLLRMGSKDIIIISQVTRTWKGRLAGLH